jgi:hypothetical protein
MTRARARGLVAKLLAWLRALLLLFNPDSGNFAQHRPNVTAGSIEGADSYFWALMR